MRETCSCGASIWAFRKSDIVEWRTNHRHDNQEQEPDKQGAFAQVERADPRYYESEATEHGGVHMPIIQASIGFQPNA